ncbi:hypothetical protein DdX_15896 [Ditylenchus destructor]|uniref:Uncharacterized protein n=1 Tax=Ditylenchus destructor TaxID=166010 RepID=A0AAD4MUK6_9BILA|nr:hypothetical protein DdX_15896 [Ditylenchus destructor]
MFRFSKIWLYLTLPFLFTIPSSISVTSESAPQDSSPDTITDGIGYPTTPRPSDKYLQFGAKFGFIYRAPRIPLTVRGGFYHKLSTALHKHMVAYLYDTYPTTSSKVSLTLLDYVPAALAYPDETGETVANHYFVGSFMSKNCGRARLTDQAQAKLQNNLTRLAAAFANEFNEPQMVVPLFVMLPQSAANCIMGVTTPEPATDMLTDDDLMPDSEMMGNYGKETELNEVLIAGLIGEAHFVEGFAPGVHMFIQKGAISFEDIGSWTERNEQQEE